MGDVNSNKKLIYAADFRETIRRHIQHYAHGCSQRDTLFAVLQWLNEEPKADAEPVRHERWAHIGGDEWRCTGCGEVIHTEGSWERPTKKFCSECGAKMNGGPKNEDPMHKV